jgi:hypothetical protein
MADDERSEIGDFVIRKLEQAVQAGTKLKGRKNRNDWKLKSESDFERFRQVVKRAISVLHSEVKSAGGPPILMRPQVHILSPFVDGRLYTISKLVILSGVGANAPHSRRIPTLPIVTMPHQGVLFETPVLTCFAARDSFHYKFWIYILVSRTGTLYIGIISQLRGLW